ncbi:hypothetical protein [Pseudonocardia sp. D17]|uniref:hypothetical protein n=1 Tax=Pseudonocardia sp. D17 TaxID=882661 RepID=UPI002B3829D6|nr:hypothetical protein PSD17_04140 [Pseudonocardia sp. D17]
MIEDLERVLDAVSDQLAAAVRKQTADRDPAHEDFYRWGWAFTELLDRVDDVAAVLIGQVSRYGDRRVLRDDRGLDPADRLVEMQARLTELRSALDAARAHARAYHSASSHIAVEVDLDTEVEP